MQPAWMDRKHACISKNAWQLVRHSQSAPSMFTDQDDSFIHQRLFLPAPYKHLKNKNARTLRPVFKALVSPGRI